MAKVNIFYQELNYRTVDETPIYSVSPPGTRAGLGAGPRTSRGPALCTSSLPTDACRCLSCFQPWAASGACGLVHLFSLSWSCWSCCLMP